MVQPLQTWSALAINLPEHADNAVHTDAGGRAAGYAGALVAGTTVYALLTHPPANAWGLDWVRSGGAEVRFLDAVLADDVVELGVEEVDDSGTGEPMAESEAWIVSAETRGERRATCRVWPNAKDLVASTGPSEPDDVLEPMQIELDHRLGDYGVRAGDDLALYGNEDVVHPAAWPAIGNRIMATQLVTGPWIHTRSLITHLGLARRGAMALAESHVTKRFATRSGERAIIEVAISVDGSPVALVEHEAIIALGSS